MPAMSRSAAARCATTGRSLAQGETVSVSIRQHEIEIQPNGCSPSANLLHAVGEPAGLPRRGARLYGRARRQDRAAGDGTARRRTSRRAGKYGCACRPNAAGLLIKGDWTHDQEADAPARSRDLDHGPDGAAASSRSAQAAPAASRITPELVEAAKKEGKVVWYTSVDLHARRAGRQGVRGQVSGIAVKVERSGAERELPAHRPGVRQQDLQLRRREQLRRRAPHHLEAREAAGAPTCPRTWRATSRPRTRIPTACSPRGASRSRRSPTTPSW